MFVFPLILASCFQEGGTDENTVQDDDNNVQGDITPETKIRIFYSQELSPSDLYPSPDYIQDSNILTQVIGSDSIGTNIDSLLFSGEVSENQEFSVSKPVYQ